ncbi:hypothetical protein CHUAL_005307 [Chamberlinius hualienensis]
MATTKEKFEAAVNVIKNLPKDGPYQPSNDMKLRFYSLYKQATEGPCQASKPAFWDVVGRVKWDAWKKLGDMTKDEAMQAYIDGLKEISLQIVETMSFTDKIADFMESVGPFYEMVELPLPKKVTDYSDDNDFDKGGSKDSGLTAFIISKNVGKHKQLEFILRSKTKNEDEPNGSEFIGSGVEHDIISDELGLTKSPLNGFERDALNSNGLNNNVNPITNGGLEWPENNSGFQENGHAPLRDGISDKFYSSNESDDEFSDPLDNDAITDDFISENGFAEYENSATFVPVNGIPIDTRALEDQQSVDKPVTLNGPVSGVTFRGGGDPTSSSFSGRHYLGASGRRNNSSGHSNAGISGVPGDYSMPTRRPTGAGGGRGPHGNQVVYDVTEQIAVALSQLQKDMESVLTRLNTLEALTVAHHHMAQGHLITHGTGSPETSKPNFPSWWPFKNMPLRAVAFFIAWPVIYHLLVKIISSSHARRLRRHRS